MARTIQGICITPNCNNKQTSNGNGTFKSICSSCHKNRSYVIHKKDHCELCGFKAINQCQLDVDHKDGNHFNNDESNLQTLCANCHRLKTFLNGDTTSVRGS